MPTKTFINLPVRDLAKAVEFFTALGFRFDPQFTSDQTTCMVISEDAYAMLHVQPAFREFTQREIPDPARSTEVIVGLSAETREQVDDLVDRALAAGGHAMGEPDDQGFMYMRGFRDPDGHQWSFIHMDMSAVAAG